MWESPPTKNGAGVGAAAGAVVGGGLGAIIGTTTGDAGTGLLVGAAAGATVGAVVGNEAQRQANARGVREDIDTQTDELNEQQRQNDELKKNLNDAQRPAVKSYTPPPAAQSRSYSASPTVINPPSRPFSAARPAVTGRIYINPPSTYAGGRGETIQLASAAPQARVSAVAPVAQKQIDSLSSRSERPLPPKPALPAAPAVTGPPAEAARPPVIETAKSSDLPPANKGSILPPPAAETAASEDGLPKLDVDDGTVKALEADEAGAEEEVLGSAAAEETTQARGRLAEEASSPAAGLPPPAGTAKAGANQLPAGAKEIASNAKSAVMAESPALKPAQRELPLAEKEVVGSQHKAELPQATEEGSTSKAGSPAPPSNDECRQATSEVQRAKSAVSDADRLFYYRRAVRLCSSEPAYHVEIGKLYINLGRTEDAKFEFQQALDIDPRNQPARDQLDRLGSLNRADGAGGKL